MLHRGAVVLPLFRIKTFIASRDVFDSDGTVVAISVFRILTIAALVAISYYAGSQIGFLLTPPDTPIAVFWPPNALLLAVLLLTPSRIWWVLVLAVLPAHLLIQLKSGIPVFSSLGWFVGNTAEALLGAAAIRFFKRDKPLFETLHGVIVFLVCGVLFPTIVTSFFDAASVVLTGLGDNYWVLWATRLTSNIISDLTIVPAIVIFGVDGPSVFRRANVPAYFEAAILALGTVVVSLLIFGREYPTNSIPAFIYAPLPVLLWAAVRFGSGGLSASMLTIALISMWNAMHHRGPFGTSDMADAVLTLHVLFTMFSVALMLLAALVAEWRSSEEMMHATRAQFISARQRAHQRAARELHDNIVQRLTLLGLDVDELRTETNLPVKPDFNKLYSQLLDISESARDLSHELHPFALEYLGLNRALEKLSRDVSAQCGIAIHFSELNVTCPLPSTVASCFFCVAQEALRNVAQHSHAKTAVMELTVEGALAVLRISDEGVGMGRMNQEGSGLTYLREHLLVLGGRLRIMSSPDKGTMIEASVPIQIPS